MLCSQQLTKRDRGPTVKCVVMVVMSGYERHREREHEGFLPATSMDVTLLKAAWIGTGERLLEPIVLG